MTYNHPSQGRANKARKVVRSHVAKLQHERTRQKKTARGRKAPPEEAESADSPASDDHSSNRGLVVESLEAHGLRYETATESEVSTPNLSSRPVSRLDFREDLDDGDEDESGATTSMTQQLAMARVDPFQRHDATLDWTVDVPSVIDRCRASLLSVSQAFLANNFQTSTGLDHISYRNA